MKYTLKFYNHGSHVSTETVEAPNPLLSLKYVYKPIYTHVVINGSRTVRLTKSGKEITEHPTAYAFLYRGKFYVIMLMFGTVSEIYYFESEEKMKEVFNCITSTSAECVTTGQERTGIIASLEGTSASKSSSMSKKILSGYVTNATWQEKLTQDSIDKPSGTPKSVATAMTTWSSGYDTSHSRLNRTLIGTVDAPERDLSFAWPGTNNSMIRLNGKTIEFAKQKSLSYGTYYKGNGWFWKTSWINPVKIYAKIKELPNGTKYRGITYNPKYANRVVKLELCGCGCGCYKYKNDFFKPEWLEINGYSRKDVNE